MTDACTTEETHTDELKPATGYSLVFIQSSTTEAAFLNICLHTFIRYKITEKSYIVIQ